MKIAKFLHGEAAAAVGRVEEDSILPLNLHAHGMHTLSDLLESDDPLQTAQELPTDAAIPLGSVQLLPPIDHQEVWAAGVTYRRSQTARMEESEAAASCYDRVYSAARPEIFFKATPHRVRGHGQPLRIRSDSKWNVPEPEITLVLSSAMKIVGYTIGNDMSSRDIEGENPLYLPQAKCYDACAGLGPWIKLASPLPSPHELGVRLQIHRDGAIIYDQRTSAAEMARDFTDLVSWLARDNPFPHGAFLMTGTGIVPDSPFTLHHGDVVDITIDGVGTLSNPIFQDHATPS